MSVAPETLTGTIISLVQASVETEDQSSYETESYDEIDAVTSFPELNESSETGTLTLLKKGITQHFNGAKIVPPFDVSYVFKKTDPGQVIVRGVVNTNTEVTLKIDYVNSGVTKYVQAVLGDLRTQEATNNSHHGETINVRPISLVTTVNA